jgi:UPF0716 family protein affecting phage T7 exclusion
MLLVYLPKTIALVLLLIVTQLIGLFVLVAMVRRLWALSLVYTKTMYRAGQVMLITSGGRELCTYGMLRQESMIQNLLALRLFDGHMGEENDG